MPFLVVVAALLELSLALLLIGAPVGVAWLGRGLLVSVRHQTEVVNAFIEVEEGLVCIVAFLGHLSFIDLLEASHLLLALV